MNTGIECGTIKHPKSTNGKYVGTYNQGGLGNSYFTEDGKVKYFDTIDDAKSAVYGKSCWEVCEITNALGD